MDALGGAWASFIDWLFQSGSIYVPLDFHSRCNLVETMMDVEVTGIVSTVINYSINSASEARFQIESSDQTLEDLLTLWLERININVDGIPTGLQELSREYYKERWSGSSLCIMKIGQWEKISIGANSITVPTVLWFVNGSSVFIHRPNEKNYKLGSDTYWLDQAMKKSQLNLKECSIQKPFSRWFNKYPSPYLVKTGVYKNWKALEILQGKSDEVISKFLPYLLLMKKGNIEGFKEGIQYDDKDLQKMVDNFKESVEKYQRERGKIPINAVPFDQSYEHLIPDLKNILNEELYNQGSRAMLSGLGFIDVIQGISSTRKESVLNPKPFVAEVNAGVEGFKSMLMDVVKLIIDENKMDHRKLFSGNNPLRIVNTPLRINIDQILDAIRSGFVYGPVSIESYHEALGIDHDKEVERMKKEWEKDKEGVNLRDLFYPHLVQNTEDKGVDTELNVKPAPVTKKQTEKQKEKEKAPPVKASVDEEPEEDILSEEAEQIINEPIDPNLPAMENIEIAPYNSVSDLPAAVKKYPATAQRLCMHVWNSTYKQTKNEARAFQAAWSQLKKWMKRHGKSKK